LEGKIALVTGGSRGIGAAVVRRLVRDGASVAFTYVASEDRAKLLESEVSALGGRSLAMRADSASAAMLQGAIDHAVDTFGGLDLFVSNAGIFRVGKVEEFSIEEFDQMVAINLRAAFVGIQAAVRRMRSGGRVITVGSSVANRITLPGASVYSMTKAALQGLVRGLAVDLAPRAITVNNVQPGPIATDINPVNGTDAAESLQRMIPLGRYGTDEEVASMVAYLCTAEAGFVTGTSLTIDGGYGS
jgi:3-oxoacyl-[acyl-carrier protein] reductase